tara:strand:- start:36 stop:347 length:312 start_codon:yes stop_codon:yes gene_type:complete
MKTKKLNRQQLDNIWNNLDADDKFRVDYLLGDNSKYDLIGRLEMALKTMIDWQTENKLHQLTKYQLAIMIVQARAKNNTKEKVVDAGRWCKYISYEQQKIQRM